MSESDRPTLAPIPAAVGESLRAVLGMRVSDVLATVPGALEVLLDHGFAPLAQPAMRRMLAPTLTLEQAIQLRALPDWRRESLLRQLAERVPAEEGATCR